jgi:hypothetical protein
MERLMMKCAQKIIMMCATMLIGLSLAAMDTHGLQKSKNSNNLVHKIINSQTLSLIAEISSSENFDMSLSESRDGVQNIKQGVMQLVRIKDVNFLIANEPKIKHSGVTYRCPYCPLDFNGVTHDVETQRNEHLSKAHAQFIIKTKKGYFYQCDTCDHAPFKKLAGLIKHKSSKQNTRYNHHCQMPAKME